MQLSFLLDAFLQLGVDPTVTLVANSFSLLVTGVLTAAV